MKYQIGDEIIVLLSHEEGKVVDIMNENMVMIEVRGVKFPAYMDQIDFPYFKKISEITGDSLKWTLYYYSESDKESAKKIMQGLNINEDLLTYKHCTELEIEDTQLKLF